MKGKVLPGLIAAGIVGLMTAATAQPAAQIAVPPGAEAPPLAPPAAAPQAPRVEVVVDDRSAQDVREQLNQLLRDYPPSLAQVLRLDPSLLTRPGYLDPYPKLAAFLAQHPDIVRHPAFYLGSPGNFNDAFEDPRSRAFRAMTEMTVSVTFLTGELAFFLLVGWLARLVVDQRRWVRAAKTQTDAHSKLLDRLTSNDELLAYIQTPAGQHFLKSAPIALDEGIRPVGAPLGRILWSVQAGIVLAVVGIGLWFASMWIPELWEVVSVVAMFVIALGVGFALSALVAYALSLRLGLFQPPKA